MNIRKIALMVAFIPMMVSLCIAQDSKTGRRTFNLPQTKAMNLPLNDAVLVGNTLYISPWRIRCDDDESSRGS